MSAAKNTRWTKLANSGQPAAAFAALEWTEGQFIAYVNMMIVAEDEQPLTELIAAAEAADKAEMSYHFRSKFFRQTAERTVRPNR